VKLRPNLFNNIIQLTTRWNKTIKEIEKKREALLISQLHTLKQADVKLLYIVNTRVIVILKFLYGPCKKFDRDSHRNSVPFLVTNRRKFGTNPHQIPWPFHVIYPGLFVGHAQTWHGFYTSSSHGISIAFSIRFGVIFDQTAVKKT